MCDSGLAECGASLRTSSIKLSFVGCCQRIIPPRRKAIVKSPTQTLKRIWSIHSIYEAIQESEGLIKVVRSRRDGRDAERALADRHHRTPPKGMLYLCANVHSAGLSATLWDSRMKFSLAVAALESTVRTLQRGRNGGALGRQLPRPGCAASLNRYVTTS